MFMRLRRFSSGPMRIVGVTFSSPHQRRVPGLAPNAWKSCGCGDVYGLGTTPMPRTVPASSTSPGTPYGPVIVFAGGQFGMPSS
jgi:hypothetical protein